MIARNLYNLTRFKNKLANDSKSSRATWKAEWRPSHVHYPTMIHRSHLFPPVVSLKKYPYELHSRTEALMKLNVHFIGISKAKACCNVLLSAERKVSLWLTQSFLRVTYSCKSERGWGVARDKSIFLESKNKSNFSRWDPPFSGAYCSQHTHICRHTHTPNNQLSYSPLGAIHTKWTHSSRNYGGGSHTLHQSISVWNNPGENSELVRFPKILWDSNTSIQGESSGRNRLSEAPKPHLHIRL